MIKPIRGYVFGEVISSHKVLESGLILADVVKEKPHRAMVLGVGGSYLDRKGREKRMCCSVGDIVHFRKPNGKYINYQGKKCVRLHNDNILAIEREKG